MTTPTNAFLRSVHPPGPVSVRGQAAVGDPAWTGRAPGYLKRDRRTASTKGQQVDVRLDVLVIRRVAAVRVLPVAGSAWEGYTVVIEDRRTGTPLLRRFRVAAMENRAAGSIADSFRIELADEQAA